MDLYQQAPHSSSAQDQRTERVLNIALDELAQRFLDATPQLDADVQVMAAMIRELVNTERETRGLDRPQGVIELDRNQEKTKTSDPDFIGSAQIAGRNYHAAAWVWGKERIRVALSLRTSQGYDPGEAERNAKWAKSSKRLYNDPS